MKGQTQAVSAVLILGVMLATLAAIYVWATPALDKQTAQNNIRELDNDVRGLGETLDTVAVASENTPKSQEINLQEGEILVNESADYVEISTTQPTDLYSGRAWNLIRGDTSQGLSYTGTRYALRGKDENPVIAVNGYGPDSGTLKYRVEFRPMLDESGDEPIIRKVELKADAGKRASGSTEVQAVNQGVEVDENGFELRSGEKVDVYKTTVEVSLS